MDKNMEMFGRLGLYGGIWWDLGFPKIRGTSLGVPTIRIKFFGVCIGVLLLMDATKFQAKTWCLRLLRGLARFF